MPQPDRQFRFASALSESADLARALDEVDEQLAARLSDRADLVAVFVTPHHIEGLGVLQDRLLRRFEPRALVGSTAESVVGRRREAEGKPAVSVLAAQMPGAHLRPVVWDERDFDAMLADPDAAKAATATDGGAARLVVLLADPFTTPLTRLLPRWAQTLPGVPFVGGVCSGTRTPGGNRLWCNGRLVQSGAVALTLGPGVQTRFTVSQGCRPVGSPLVVTRTRDDRNYIVAELGGRNALGAIRTMIQGLHENEQAIVQSSGLLVGCVINEYKQRFGRGDFLIRGIVGVDQDAGHVAIGEPDLKVGQTIQLHVRDQGTAREDFALLLEAHKLDGPGDDGSAGGLLFTCNGRGRNLFDEPDTDAALVHDALGDMPLAGFFAAGEIGPVGPRSYLHGHTASLLVLRPED